MELPARIGKYELEEFLGGGMSHVYRAQDTVIGRTVAIKILTEQGCQDPEIKARFLAEARMAGNIRHENIISIFDFGEDQHRPFMVMEFLDGKDLRQAIRDGTSGDIPKRLRIALDIARAIAYIHLQKIIHRDLKPENIHITRQGVVKLMDFGIAKTEGLSLTRAGFVLGTPYYMSPEQVRGVECDRRADVYSFGLLLFELMTGRRAVQGDTVERLFYAILNEPIDLEPLRESGVPDRVRDLIERCTEKNPDQRPQDMDAVCSALEQAIQDSQAPTAAPRPVPVPMPSANRPAGWLRPVAIVATCAAAGFLFFGLRFVAGGPGESGASLAVLLALALAIGLLAAAIVRRRLARRSPAADPGSAQPVPAQSPARPAPMDDSRQMGRPSYPEPGWPWQVPSPASKGSEISPPPVPATPAGAPAPRSSGPGEFTQMFQAGAPTPAPAQAAPLASPVQTSKPVSFTDLFGKMPAAGPAPPDVPKPAPPPPPPVPAGFPPASSASPAASASPPATPGPEPGEFTQIFQTAPPAGARTNEGLSPAAPAPPPPDSSESTQLFSLRRGAAGEPESSLIPDVSLTITQCEEHTHENRSFRLDHFPFRIGRGPESRHLSFDSAISRDHAEISLLNGVFFIEDLGSNNGTFLDGCELLPHRPEPLLFNSRILLGSNTELMFVSNELEELPDLTGTLIGVRYTLGKRLFSNTKSALYAAADGTIPRTVALRILSPKLAQNEEYRQQFQNQAVMAGRLQHSYINRVLDFGEAYLPNQLGKSLYLCMDYLQGGNLQTRLQQNEPISLDRVVDWLDKLSQALDYIHGENVVHGGIKPSSIVFDSRENPHLGDFAIAANTGRTRRYFLSRPGFMAPEQWEGNVEAASDQYSLAAMMYLVVTGSHPYEGQGHPEKRKRNYLRPPVPAHEKAAHNLRGGVPPAISPVLQRALSLSPKDRFPSAASFAAAFRDGMTQKSPERRTRPLVFLSYRRSASLALALLLKNGLEGQHGCEVFLDLDSQRDAGEFPDHLSSRCQASDVFVCLLSRTTLQSKWVDAEVEAAYSARKPMVPVSHESYHYPKDLRSCSPHVQALLRSNGLTVLDRRGEYIQEAISKLSDIIRQALAG